MTPPVLHTERLTLRPPTLADAPVMVDYFTTTDTIVGAYQRCSANDAKARLEGYIAHWNAKNHGMWMLEVAGGEVIGAAGLVWEDDFPSHELTWFLFPRHRGAGYAAEASRAVIAWGYDIAGFDPVETYIRDENAPARALAARLGGVVTRRETFPDAVTRDVFALPHPGRARILFPERIETERLVLRRPIAADRHAYCAFGFSPRAQFVTGAASEENAAKNFYAITGHWDTRGFGRYMMVRRDDGRAIGHCGPLQSAETAPVEMTWTLWDGADEGHGLAAEAATAVRDVWLSTPGAPPMIAMVHPENTRSTSLARRLGGVEDADAQKPEWSDKAIIYRFGGAAA